MQFIYILLIQYGNKRMRSDESLTDYQELNKINESILKSSNTFELSLSQCCPKAGRIF